MVQRGINAGDALMRERGVEKLGVKVVYSKACIKGKLGDDVVLGGVLEGDSRARREAQELVVVDVGANVVALEPVLATK